MTKPIEPIVDLLSAFGTLMPENDRLANLKKVLEATQFCEARRDKMTGGVDHSNCEPLEVLDGFFQKMKEAGISISATVPGDKKREPFVYALFRRLNAHKCDELCDFNAGEGRELAEYLFARATELGVPNQKVSQAIPVELPDVFYCRRSKDYWIESPNGLQPLNCEATKAHLAIGGLSSRPDDSGLSEIDRKLAEIRDYKAVDQVLSLAGYPSGVYTINGHHILVDRGFDLIEPASEDGPFSHIDAILQGLLIDRTAKTDTEKSDPYFHFLRHLQRSYLELQSGERSGSIATFLCGPTDSGKSLLLEIIVALLGGRYGNAYLYVSGQTTFNDELMSKELWIIDDGVPLSDHSARKRLSGLLKQSVAAGHVACHGKGKAQISLPLYRRMFVALNDDDMDGLPYLAESLEDKYMLLKVNRFNMPKGCTPLPERKDRPAFMALLKAELPFFLRWLLAQDLSEYGSRRFGVIAHKNAELVTANAEASGLELKYAVLCKVLFGTEKRRSRDAVEMTTAQIWIELNDEMRGIAGMASVFRNGVSLGIALGELSTSTTHRHLVTRRTKRGYSVWTIKQDAVDTLTIHHHPHHDKRSINNEDEG